MSSVYLSSELILYRYTNRPSARCPLAYLANVYRLLPKTNSSKQQGLKHWQYHLEGTVGVTSARSDRYTPMRCMPMRCTPVRCTPVRCALMGCTLMRCTGACL